MNINDIKNLLKRGRIEETISELLIWLEPKCENMNGEIKTIYNELLQISGRNSILVRRQHQGTQTEEKIKIEENKILDYLIKQVDFLEKNIQINQPNSSQGIVNIPNIEEKNDAKLVQIRLTIDRDFDEFSEADKDIVIGTIGKLLKIKNGEIIINKVERGSVIMNITLPLNKAKELIELIETGKLKDINIFEGEIMNYNSTDRLVDYSPAPIEANYVFMFGATGVGKTTFLAAFHSYLFKQESVKVVRNISVPKLNFLPEIWSESLLLGEFPPKNNSWEPLEINSQFQLSNTNFPISFIEMSSEQLLSIDIKRNLIAKKIPDFMMHSDVIVLFAEVGKGEDDMLIHQFVENLDNKNISKPIAFILTKFDKIRKEKINLIDYVKKEFPLSYQALEKNPQNQIFSFSVGETEMDENNVEKIKELNLDMEKIASFIFNNLE